VEKKKIAKIHFSGHTLEIATLSNRMIVDAPDALWGDYCLLFIYLYLSHLPAERSSQPCRDASIEEISAGEKRNPGAK
jgi:hypothetical protein